MKRIQNAYERMTDIEKEMGTLIGEVNDITRELERLKAAIKYTQTQLLMKIVENAESEE